MTTAVDTSVLLAVFNDEPQAEAWGQALLGASREGVLVICEVVFAEIAPAFDSRRDALMLLDRLGIRFDPILEEAAYEAGRIFKAYRKEGGPRMHMIPDFLIGAHAQRQADRLAAEDRGYLRRYFPKLHLLKPGR